MGSNTTRSQIVAAADNLFYQQGFGHTSFSDIAEVVSISRGNFYHHFKTKDDILDAVIELRLAKTQEMLDQWESECETPKDCIKRYIHILLTNWSKIKDHGCPVGTLCTELAKLNHASQYEANQVFTLFRKWLKKQFILYGRPDDADELAMYVLAWSQGVATLGNAFQDRRFITREVERICQWLAACVDET